MKVVSCLMIISSVLFFYTLAAEVLTNSVSANLCAVDDPPVKFISQTSPPGHMSPDESADVKLTLVNCGTESWIASQSNGQNHKLGAFNPLSNSIWGVNRIALPANVAPQTSVTINFTVKAPTTEGTYVFQFALLQEYVSWYLPPGPPAIVSVGRITTCAEAENVKNKPDSATAILQSCIDKAPAGTVLEIPPGVYTLTDQLKIKKRLTLRTAGLAGNTQTCLLPGAPECAVFKAHSNFPNTRILWTDTFGLINITQGYSPSGIIPTNDVNLDHIVLDGNRAARRHLISMCNEPNNMHHCLNTEWYSSNSKIFYSASVNNLMASGFWIHGSSNTVAYTLFADNGQNLTGNQEWSDGMTSTSSRDAVYMYNMFRDNSDIDFIMADGAGSRVYFNRVIHTRADTASWGGMMLDNFGQAGYTDYTGSDIAYNMIDCKNRCGFGFIIGGQSWNKAAPHLISPYVHHNTIRRVAQGMNVAGAGTSTGPLKLGPNSISEVGGVNTGNGFTSGTLNVGTYNIVTFTGSPNPDSTHPWQNYTFSLQYIKPLAIGEPSAIFMPALSSLPVKTTAPKPGDLNGSGHVDIFDYNLLVSKFGNPYTIYDYNKLVANFGK